MADTEMFAFFIQFDLANFWSVETVPATQTVVMTNKNERKTKNKND